MDGPSIDEPEDDGLAHDVACVLLRYTRDRPNGGVIGRRLSESEVKALADELAPELGQQIGGRYLPKMGDSLRRKRNAEIYAKFTGNNHQQLARLFGISRKTVSRAIADHKRRLRSQALGWSK